MKDDDRKPESDGSNELPPTLKKLVYEKGFYSLDEVARICGFSRRHAYTLVSLGQLRLTRLGRRLTRVSCDDLAAFLVRARG